MSFEISMLLEIFDFGTRFAYMKEQTPKAAPRKSNRRKQK